MFKDISGQFRAGKLSSSSYFSQCRELVASHKFNKFFPELLILLPDIKKQQVVFTPGFYSYLLILFLHQELFVLYKADDKSNVECLSECPTCYQITFTLEVEKHAETHLLDNDFPQL